MVCVHTCQFVLQRPHITSYTFSLQEKVASAKADSELGAVRTKLASTQVEVQNLTHQLSGSRSNWRNALSQCRQLLYFVRNSFVLNEFL